MKWHGNRSYVINRRCFTAYNSENKQNGLKPFAPISNLAGENRYKKKRFNVRRLQAHNPETKKMRGGGGGLIKQYDPNTVV